MRIRTVTTTVRHDVNKKIYLLSTMNNRITITHTIRLAIISTYFMLMFLHSVKCEPDHNRTIILPSELVNVIEGESIVLKCQQSPFKHWKYIWKYNGDVIKYSNRIYQQLGSDLHIKHTIGGKDDGNYVCVAKNMISGARKAFSVTIRILWLKSVNLEIAESSPTEIILQCTVNGSPDTKVQWYRNEIPIRSTETNDRQLLVKKPNRVISSAIYRCSARNEMMKMFSAQTFLWPNIRPVDQTTCLNGQFIEKLIGNSESMLLCRNKRGDRSRSQLNNPSMEPNNMIKRSGVLKMIVNESEAIVVNCFDGKHGSKKGVSIVKWKKDDKSFRHVNLSGKIVPTQAEPTSDMGMIREDARISPSTVNGSLIFSSVISIDAGMYECSAFDEDDTVLLTKKIELRVIEELKFAPQPTSKILELGSVGKVHCKVQGTPTPTIKWTKDFLSELPQSVDDINGTLIFKNVTAFEKGNYTCTASNTQGTITATVPINVVVSPKFIVAPIGPIQAIEMRPVMIHCQAYGDPVPTVQWDKDLNSIQSLVTTTTPSTATSTATSINGTGSDQMDRFHILPNGTLFITEVHLEDEGKYGCTIGNSGGLKREEIQLAVKSVEDTVNDETEGFMITKAVLITMSVAFAYIVLVVGLMWWCRIKRQARKARFNVNDKMEGADNGGTELTLKNIGEIEPCLPSEVATKSKQKSNGISRLNGTIDGAQKSDDTAASTASKMSKKSSQFDKIAIPSTVLIDLVQIGRGEFGEIFVGKIKSKDLLKPQENGTNHLQISTERDGNKRSKTSLNDINEIKEESGQHSDSLLPDEQPLLAKALNNVKDENNCIEFRRQIEMFRAVTSDYVVKLFGLCRDKDPHLLLLEHSDLGDLKSYLLTGQDATNILTVKQRITIAHQIAKGMDAIYRARYIHKDLAARNCALMATGNRFHVKISYPALKDKFKRDYCKHKNSTLPIRWMAPECIRDSDEFSTKSDIYSFGVLAWELFTGEPDKLPMEELTNQEFIERAEQDRLEREVASETPASLRILLSSCWTVNPKERPSFNSIQSALGKYLTEQSIDLLD